MQRGSFCAVCGSLLARKPCPVDVSLPRPAVLRGIEPRFHLVKESILIGEVFAHHTRPDLYAARATLKTWPDPKISDHFANSLHGSDKEITRLLCLRSEAHSSCLQPVRNLPARSSSIPGSHHGREGNEYFISRRRILVWHSKKNRGCGCRSDATRLRSVGGRCNGLACRVGPLDAA